MPSSNDSWGIEVGSHAIKAVHLQKDGDDVKLAEFEVIPHKKVLTTPDVDVEESIRLGLSQFASNHEFAKSSVVVSVPGTMAFARFAKLPPVEPKRINDIVKFEAVQQIPFPIEQVEWDYQIFQDDDSPDVEVGIFAITKQRVMEWLSHFDAAGVPVHGVTLCPISVYNAMMFDLDLDDESSGAMFIDVGTQTTDLVIASEGRVWLRTLPMGGHHFTEALVRSFKLSYTKAEKIKKEAATSKYARQIFQAMRPVFVDLVGEIQKSLGYYQSMNREASIEQVIGMGSTFRLPGLQKFIKQQLQLETNRLDSFSKIEAAGKEAAGFTENAPTLAPAYGLALQGMELEKVSANILPESLIRQSIWKRKTKWNIAAAALIAASASLPVARLFIDQGAYAAANTEHGSSINSVISRAEGLKKEWEATRQDDPRKSIDNLRAINDYSHIWPYVIQDVQLALESTNPQQELLDGSVEDLKKIPRGERRWVRVTDLSADYSPTGEASGSRGRSTRRRGNDSDETEDTPKSAALFVTLKGETPYQDIFPFLRDSIIKWLNEDSALVKRPYRITGARLAERGAARSSSELERSARRGTRTRTTRRSSSTEDERRERAGVEVVEPRNRSGYRSPSPRSNTGKNLEKTTVRDFFPSDPVADEDASRDSEFTITWKIELLPPDEARRIVNMSQEEWREVLDAKTKALEDTEAEQGDEDAGANEEAE